MTTTNTTTLRCWVVRAAVEHDGQLLDAGTAEILGLAYGRYYATEASAEDAAQDLRDDSCDITPTPEYMVALVTLTDDVAMRAVERWTDEDMAAAHWAHCESGLWSEARCPMAVPLADAVEVQYVPDAHRETFRQCGQSWRGGIAKTITVCRGCADYMRDVDGEYVRVM